MGAVVSCFQAIGDCIMTVISAIAGVIMSIINGCVAVLAAIVRFLTCTFFPPSPSTSNPPHSFSVLPKLTKSKQAATVESAAEAPPARRDGTA